MDRPVLFQFNQNLSALEKQLLEREKEILNQDKNAKFYDWEKVAEGIPVDDDVMMVTENEVPSKKSNTPVKEKTAIKEPKKETPPPPKPESSEKQDSDAGEDDIGADSSDDDESIVSDVDSPKDDDDVSRQVAQLKAEADKHTKNCRWKEAIELYTEALKHRQLATLFGNRSLCYQKLEEFEKSEKDCTRALSLEWKYKKMYKRRAALRLRLRNYYGCAADLQNVIILSADDSSKDPLVAEQYCALVRLARIDKTDRVSGTGDPEIRRLEEETLGRICELNESHAVGLLNRGDAGDAIDYLLMAMMAAPESARLYGLRASAYVKRGDLAQAEADLTTAVRLDPTNPRFLRLRAELRRKRDDKDGAAEDEQAAKKLSRSRVNVSNTANKPRSTSNISTADSPSNEPTQWTSDSIIEIVQKSTTEPAKKTVKSTPKSTATLDTVNGSCDEPLSKMIRLSVEDVYSSSAGELLNLSELPVNIRRILT